MPTTTWLGCIVVAVYLLHGTSTKAAPLPLDDATRIALGRLTLYLEEMGQDTRERASQYRPRFDFVKPIPRLSTAGQLYTVELPRESGYRQSRFDAPRVPELAGSRSMSSSQFTETPQRLQTADFGTFLEYLKNAIQPTDDDILGKNALSANKRQPPSGFHAVRGKRSVYS
ncbi:hypothetical protein LSAT2_007646 [Lamellibrachia satsuma]|nr:hypothetical protein LSAT2_007646 [Lamellibrachia satsuma]